MYVVGITGASGFIGSHLVAACLERGWSPIALVRRGSPELAALGIPVRSYRIGEAPPDLAGIDLLVHCAYDAQADNASACEALIRRAAASGVRRLLFVSSLSADPQAASRYGREKAACEAIVAAADGMVVRPGLVLGAGGLFARMRDAVRGIGVVPLVDGGRQPVYTVTVGELAAAILDLLAADARGTFAIAASEPVSMAELYRAIARACGRRVLLVPIPYAPLLLGARLAEALRIPLALTVERVRSLRNLRAVTIPSYPQLPRAPRPFSPEDCRC